MRILVVIAAAVAFVVAALWFGFAPLVQQQTADSIDPPTGYLAMEGLSAPVSIRRDEYGVPLIEAENVDDLAFATGYAMAQDRLNQMVGMSLSAQGRLAEMVGEAAYPLDVYMRALGVHRAAEMHFREVPPDLQRAMQRFSDGVNAWVGAHHDRLPMGLWLAGYTPEPWTPMHSMDVYMLLNLGLALNLHQEVEFLNIAAKVGAEKAAWLLPTMPDEALPFDEAGKLTGADFAALAKGADTLAGVQSSLASWLSPVTVAASNNWVIAPQRTAGNASILANDTHLLLQHPPLWMLMQLRAPGYNATGIAVAGIPGIVAGYNGHIAWGMTMVMADGQDLFVEQLKRVKGNLQYRLENAWQPAGVREEEFRIQGQSVSRKVLMHRTRHGPLIDMALREARINPVQPASLALPETVGLALAWTAAEPDGSLAALWQLARAQTMAQAQAAIRDVRYIHLNVVFADKENIGWQVTGRYPLRKKGSGKFPSPGWFGEYDWNGWVNADQHPAVINPAAGFFGTANDRKVPPGYPINLGSSWFYPERGERIDQMLAARTDHTADTSIAMQADQVNLFAQKLKKVLLGEPFAGALKKSLAALPGEDGLRALEALAALGGWDGNQQAESKDALIFALFQDALPRAAFLDELGPDESSPAWQSLLNGTVIAYSATQDHLLQRDDSPFWDDVRTPDIRETKADIVARALADSIRVAEAGLGKDRAQWQWGRLHTYTWKSPASEMREHLPWTARFAVDRLAGYTDRGPFPAGGDHNTLNVSGSRVGSGNFAVETVPAMRMVVDFSKDEPVQLVIAGGQSDDPASPHYADGIPLYLSMKNRAMPFNDAAARHAQFRDELVLLPASILQGK